MPPCRICGADAAPEPLDREENGYALAQCPACATVVTTRRPSPEELAAVYDELFSTGDYEQHRREFEALERGEPRWGRYRAMLLGRIGRRVEGRTLFEIGGGTGGFGMLARHRGWSYTDFDISEAAVGFARRLGLEATVFPADGVPPVGEEAADVIAMWEVIEHVWEVADYLDSLLRGLRAGGLLALTTPNWHYVEALPDWGPLSSPPLHCNFFSEDSLRGVLRKAGFRDIEVFQKRLVTPAPNLRSVLDVAKRALGLAPCETLVAYARKV